MSFIMTTSGQAAIASSVKQANIGMLVGQGDPAWGQEPPAPFEAITELVDPIGFIRPRGIFFTFPDENGILETVEGNWSTSINPTKWLYMEFALNYHDGGDSIVREMAFYINPQLAADVPEGQEFVPMGSVESAGSLLAIKHKAPIELLNTKVVFKEVVSF